VQPLQKYVNRNVTRGFPGVIALPPTVTITSFDGALAAHPAAAARTRT
jgi:hypothetical protein